MITHELKVYPKFWDVLRYCAKPFEVRRNDRNFRVGDVCLFREYDPKSGFTGRGEYSAVISYILHAEDFEVGLKPGYVMLGFGACPNLDDGK